MSILLCNPDIDHFDTGLEHANLALDLVEIMFELIELLARRLR